MSLCSPETIAKGRIEAISWPLLCSFLCFCKLEFVALLFRLSVPRRDRSDESIFKRVLSPTGDFSLARKVTKRASKGKPLGNPCFTGACNKRVDLFSALSYRYILRLPRSPAPAVGIGSFCLYFGVPCAVAPSFLYHPCSVGRTDRSRPRQIVGAVIQRPVAQKNQNGGFKGRAP